MKHNLNQISTLKCKIGLRSNFPDKLISAVLPENHLHNKETAMKINYIRLNHSSYFVFEGFTKIKTLRHTVNDLLTHLEFAEKTWNFVSDHHY